MSKDREDIVTVRGTGNIFADLGYADAETHLLKAGLVSRIHDVMLDQKLTQSAAASLMGLSQPDVSRLLRGPVSGCLGRTPDADADQAGLRGGHRRARARREDDGERHHPFAGQPALNQRDVTDAGEENEKKPINDPCRRPRHGERIT